MSIWYIASTLDYTWMSIRVNLWEKRWIRHGWKQTILVNKPYSTITVRAYQAIRTKRYFYFKAAAKFLSIWNLIVFSSVQKAKSIFLLFIMAVVLFSSMQLRLCPEIPVIINGHVVHGLCAIRAKSTKPTFWPPMGCKNIVTHYNASEDHSTVIIKAPLKYLLLPAILNDYSISLCSANAYFINYSPPQNTDPPQFANSLRGPPFLV